jgi:predicted DNA-binding protein (UPF0251 family)
MIAPILSTTEVAMKRQDNESPKGIHCDTDCDIHRDRKNVTVIAERGLPRKITLGKGIRLKARRNVTVKAKSTGVSRGFVTVNPENVTVNVTVNGMEAAGLVMKEQVKLLWLPSERAAELLNICKRTLWRQVKDRKLVAVKRDVRVGRRATRKTFILADQTLYRLEREDCESKGIEPRIDDQAVLTIKEKEYPSMFVMGYDLVGTSQKGGGDE